MRELKKALRRNGEKFRVVRGPVIIEHRRFAAARIADQPQKLSLRDGVPLAVGVGVLLRR
jgi:hypothetical protein